MRIVSLLGSATEIVYALGLERYLVGISHECDYPPATASLPRVSKPRFDPAGLTSGEIDEAVRRSMEVHGSVYKVDEDLLQRLRPTLLLTQDVCEVCAVPTGSVLDSVRALRDPPDVVSLDAHTIDQLLMTVRVVANAAGAPGIGQRLVVELRGRIEKVAEAVLDRPPPRVLLLEWLDPLFGPGHWVPEMVEMAGGECLIGSAGERSRVLDPEELSDLRPDVLLIEPCGYDVDAAAADAERHRDLLHSLAADAIGTGRAWALDSALFSRSGPRVVDGMELLASIFHPAAGLSVRGGARRWQ